MSQPFKVCPQCQTSSIISAALCASCGRIFQTTAPTGNQTQVFSGISPSANPRNHRIPRALVFGCTAPVVCFLVLFVIGAFTQHTPQPGPQAVALADQMKPYETQSIQAFVDRFGAPQSFVHSDLFKVPIDYMIYLCADGRVKVALGDSSKVIVDVRAEGYYPNLPFSGGETTGKPSPSFPGLGNSRSFDKDPR
jgi:hypothetical protein